MLSSVTLLYAQVSATEDKVIENEKKIEVIRQDLGSINTQQRVIIQQIESEKERSKDFRNRTDHSLDRILDMLKNPSPYSSPSTDDREGPR